MAEVLNDQTPELPESEPASRPLVELLTLSAPTVAQMASYTVLQFTDTWMLSRVGEMEATAGGNAGMFAFSFIGFGSGVLMLVNTLVSQNFGRKDYEQCGRYMWQGVWFAVLFAALILPSLATATLPFIWFGHEAAMVQLEAGYYRIAVGGAVLKLASAAVGQFLLGINRPAMVLGAAVVGMLVNVWANWVLIFGHWGVAPMGVAGAAWATNIAVAVELAVLGVIVAGEAGRHFGVHLWRPRIKEMGTLIRVGVPSGGQFVADILAWTLFIMMILGVFGTKVMAANTFAFRFWQVSFMPAIGISVAATALVGRYIGMKRPDLAEARAHLAFWVSAVYMLSCGVFFYVMRFRLMAMFTDDPDIVRTGATVLVFAAIYQFFDAMYIVYNGALRGAGDTFVPALAVLVLCWGLVVGGGYAMATLRPDLGPAGPWTMATLYGAVLGAFMYARFRRGKWKLIRLERLEGPAPLDRLPGFEVIAVSPDAAYLGNGQSKGTRRDS